MHKEALAALKELRQIEYMKLIAATAEITVPNLIEGSTKERIEDLQKLIERLTKNYTDDEVLAALIGVSGLIAADKIVTYSMKKLAEITDPK